MEHGSFSPGVRAQRDVVADTLTKIAHTCLIVAVGFLPLIFIPGVLVALGHTKVFVVAIAATLAIMAYAFVFLRTGSVTVQRQWPLVALWGIALAALISTLLSGDVRDAMIGDGFAPATTAGLALLALVATLMLGLGTHKGRAMRLFVFLLLSVTVLAVFHVVRIMFGAEFLSFGIFGGATASPVGSWNDLAIFFGLAIILSLVAVEQLALSRMGHVLFGGLVLLSLAMLLIVNFSAMWLILGLISLAVLMYSITRNRFSSTPALIPGEESSVATSIVLSGVVFVVSLASVIGGSFISAAVTNLTNISYIEVRPSVEATLDVARAALSENALTGLGPNRFSDGWRQYKDPSINETIFWNTNFNAGSGFIPTSMIETGILGIIAWLLFLGSFLVIGLRTLFATLPADRVRNFVLIASFVSALYIWIMAIIYVPGPVTLVLGAAMTGLFLGTRAQVSAVPQYSFTVRDNRRAGFALVGGVMVTIVSTIGAMYFVGQHYTVLASFNGAIAQVQETGDVTALEQQIVAAFNTYPNDGFARELALIQLGKINSLLTVAEPTPTQQQEFQSAVEIGLRAAQEAINADSAEPQNWQVQGQIISVLVTPEEVEASDRAAQSYARARELDPQSPIYPLLEAQLASRIGNGALAREKVTEAIRLKRNYTDALFFLTQLEVAEGNVPQAIAATEAIVSLEPQNPARYYQLGVLYAADDNRDASLAAFREAVRLDPNFANARYFLGLGLLDAGEREAALAELRAVASLNPDNAELAALITGIESGEVPTVPAVPADQATENTEPVATDGEQVTVSDEPDTNLVTPVNTVPAAPEATPAPEAGS